MRSEAAPRSTERSPHLNGERLPFCSVGRTYGEVGRVVVWVLGELDVSSAPELRAVLEDLASSGRSTLLDLSATTFMDCAGMAVILRAVATSERLDWPFVVADGAPPVVTTLFDHARGRVAATATPEG